MKKYTCRLVHVFFCGDCHPVKLERGITMGDERGPTMGDLHRLFTLNELKDLDLRDLEILKTAITNVLHTDDEIRVILERRVRDVYNRLKQPPSP
jgi:hypothetical protein